MKTNPYPIFTAGLAALLAVPTWVLAIEGPTDDAPPPPAVEPPAKPADRPAAEDNAGGAADVAKPKAAPAFLGVVSAEVPPDLADHLDLQPGEGIVVRAMLPDGPAAKAGVAIHDVITRVADKAVGSLDDLTREVGAHKPGDTIRLDIIHKGKPAGVDVTLGERPRDMAAAEPAPLDDLPLDGVPKELADRVRGLVEGNFGKFELKFGDNLNPDGAKIEEKMKEMADMHQRMADKLQGLNALPLRGGIDVHHGASIQMMDEQGSIELKSNDGSKEVTVRDKDQKIIWNGPWDTDQDKAAAPQDVRQRIERLNIDSKFQGNGLRLHFRPLKK